MSFVKSAGIVRKAEDSVFLTFLFVRKKMVLIYISTLENHRKAGVGKSSHQYFLFI